MSNRSLKRKQFKYEIKNNNGGLEYDLVKIIFKVKDRPDSEIKYFVDYYPPSRLMSYFRSYGITVNDKKLILVPFTTPKELEKDSLGLDSVNVTKVDKGALKFEEYSLLHDKEYFIIIDMITKSSFSIKFELVDEFLTLIDKTKEELETIWNPLNEDFINDDMLADFYEDLRNKIVGGTKNEQDIENDKQECS